MALVNNVIVRIVGLWVRNCNLLRFSYCFSYIMMGCCAYPPLIFVINVCALFCSHCNCEFLLTGIRLAVVIFGKPPTGSQFGLHQFRNNNNREAFRNPLVALRLDSQLIRNRKRNHCDICQLLGINPTYSSLDCNWWVDSVIGCRVIDLLIEGSIESLLPVSGAVIMGVGSMIFMVPHFTSDSSANFIVHNVTQDNICRAVSLRQKDMDLGRLTNGRAANASQVPEFPL